MRFLLRNITTTTSTSSTTTSTSTSTTSTSTSTTTTTRAPPPILSGYVFEGYGVSRVPDQVSQLIPSLTHQQCADECDTRTRDLTYLLQDQPCKWLTVLPYGMGCLIYFYAGDTFGFQRTDFNLTGPNPTEQYYMSLLAKAERKLRKIDASSDGSSVGGSLSFVAKTMEGVLKKARTNHAEMLLHIDHSEDMEVDHSPYALLGVDDHHTSTEEE